MVISMEILLSKDYLVFLYSVDHTFDLHMAKIQVSQLIDTEGHRLMMSAHAISPSREAGKAAH